MSKLHSKPNHVEKIILRFDNGEEEEWENGLAIRLHYNNKDEPERMQINTTKKTSTLLFLDLIDAFQKFVQDTFLSKGENENGSTEKTKSSSE